MLDAVAWLAAAIFGAIGLVLCLLSRRLFGGYLFAAIAFLALVTNPLLLSMLGLETLLYTLLFLLSLLLFLEGRLALLAVRLAAVRFV